MTENLVIRLIPTDLVNQFIPLVKSHIEGALTHADVSFEQVKVFLTGGSWSLLLVTDEEENLRGAYTLAYTNGPNDRVATIVTAGGAGLASQYAFDRVCEIAKSNGATKIQALAQQSQARLYRRAGLVEKAILMEKKLWVE